MFHIMTIRLVTVGAASVFLLGACSPGDEEADSQVATLQASQEDIAAAADAAVRQDESAPDLAPDEAALEFSQCMRDQGLDFPDLSVDAEGNIELRAAFQSIDRGTDGFREAMDSCGDVLQQAGFGGGRRQAAESTEFQDALVEFSECLRDDGFDVGDLTLGGGPGQGGGAADGGAQDQGQGEGEGEEQAEGQRGQRAQGFGNRGARFAENLGLDYEDPAVAESVDGCLVIVDEALSDLGIEAGQGRG